MLAASVCAGVCLPRYAVAQETKEYLVKAAFIYNFVKFVEWPGEKAINRQGGIDICVMGDTPLIKAGSVFSAASTAKLRLSLVQENDAAEAGKHCHVLFIGDSESARLRDVQAALRGSPVLTVSDMEEFAERGGMIGFVLSDGKIKVVVNTKSAALAGLRIDAQLLEIALRVIDR